MRKDRKCRYCGVDTIRGRVPVHLYTCPLDTRQPYTNTINEQTVPGTLTAKSLEQTIIEALDGAGSGEWVSYHESS